MHDFAIGDLVVLYSFRADVGKTGCNVYVIRDREPHASGRWIVRELFKYGKGFPVADSQLIRATNDQVLWYMKKNA